MRRPFGVCIAAVLMMVQPVLTADRTVDPTFLHRFVPSVPALALNAAAPGCRYKALFGAGDSEARIVRGIVRYGEITVDPGGACAPEAYSAEEQVYVILEGHGTLTYGVAGAPVGKNDFLYLPPGISHGVANPSSEPLRLIVMGFRIPEGTTVTAPAKLQVARIDDVPLQTVGGHPPTTLYRLLMGDTASTRDRIAAGHVLTSLFIMEFAPGGTNFPHHHETEEEIYLLLDGHGDMVAGGGVGGIEGRHPAKPGDAYFFRLNCTVGFYNSPEPGSKARILAVRSRFPFPKRP